MANALVVLSSTAEDGEIEVRISVRSLQDVLDYEEPDLEDVFCLNFEVTREVFGEIKVIPLKPGGSEIPVTQSNKRRRNCNLFTHPLWHWVLYLCGVVLLVQSVSDDMHGLSLWSCMYDLILNKGVHKHYKAFHEGFHKVCGGRVLELFHAHELMAVVVGNENYNWEEFESNAEYRNGYTATDPTIIMFWEVFHELSLEDKKKFLLYLTGSDRIPIQGMKAIKVQV
uniref:HECT-type E3 ubiquitin transferase n=1 Tax=Timema cristinae TaxID=61476 RepID=A0A7R9HB89_TIMCR|nr:unnamed protein product [Timema cristinae]